MSTTSKRGAVVAPGCGPRVDFPQERSGQVWTREINDVAYTLKLFTIIDWSSPTTKFQIDLISRWSQTIWFWLNDQAEPYAQDPAQVYQIS